MVYAIIKMTILNLKFVSYLGGSGGDWFSKSLNGYAESLNGQIQKNDDSLKPYEFEIENSSVNFLKIVETFKNEYISTHLFDYLLDRKCSIISIVVDDPITQNKIILRQMSLQRLNIRVNHDQTFFKIVKNFCQKQKFEQAADIWFDMAKKLWLSQMTQRIYTPTIQLNFNHLFDKKFTESIRQQGWSHNVDLIEKNHNAWLEKNQNFSIDNTLEKMTLKLTTMDWSQQSGIITAKNSNLV